MRFPLRPVRAEFPAKPCELTPTARGCPKSEKRLTPRGARRVALALLLGVVLAPDPALRGQTDTQFLPLSEVHAGLKGVGRTIFSGDKVEEFQVEILGVLKNVLAPKRDLIVARLSGGPLEKTGVIAGMSGSPVYVQGKLVGAVAISFPFAKEPLAGITPISDMLEMVPKGQAPAVAPAAMDLPVRIARVSTGSTDAVRLIPEDDSGPQGLAKLLPRDSGPETLTNLRLPLRYGGFSQEAVSLYAPVFRELGFELAQGAGLAGSDQDQTLKTDLEPGSMVSLLLVYGDLNLNADCTVTLRQGDQLYACGHRIVATGPAAFPFAPSRVLVTVPSLLSSFKLDTVGPVVGTIRQDRFSAIYGTVGDKGARMIPVQVHVDSTLNRQVDYKFEVVQEPFLTPLLFGLSLVSTLTATEPSIGPSTLELKGQIRLAGSEPVNVEDVVSADAGTAGPATAALSTPLTYLMGSGLPDLRVEGIDLSVISREEKRIATLEQVWSTQSEVRPGDHIEVTALLRLPSGEALTQKIPVDIPPSVSDKMLSLVVGSGAALNALQLRFTPGGSTPRDLQQLVLALNRLRRNNRVYALLMAPQRSFIIQGDEYPSPPPSLVQTFLSDPAVSSSVIFSGTSVVGDFETKPFPYTIRGQKNLILKVVGPGI